MFSKKKEEVKTDLKKEEPVKSGDGQKKLSREDAAKGKKEEPE